MASISAAAKLSPHGKVLIFVHGFNNRFDDAVYRFAQIVHDSKTPPSQCCSHGHPGAR